VLDISSNDFDGVSSLSSLAYEHLQILFVNKNKIQSLPVLNCPNLELFNFSDNQVTSL